jgi:hypothetical protein
MADLRTLHEALDALGQAGKTGIVSFYFMDDGLHLQSGSIFVEDGSTCYVHLRKLDPDEALAAIVGLKFAKVTTMPSTHADHAGDVVGLPMAIVLEQLDPATHAAQAVPAPAPVAPRPITNAAAPAVAPAAAAPSSAKPHVFYSHLAMQKDALDLLEPLFGTGAAKKLEEIARQSPPHQYPADFLGKCRQHAAMMLGAKKAEELFAPLFGKLAH